MQRLVLLRQAVELGHRISEIANLPMGELHALVGRDQLPGIEASPRIPYSHVKLVEMAIAAATALDPRTFRQCLLQATRTLAVPTLFENFVEPLLGDIERRLQAGELRAVNAQFASAHLRTFLGDLLTSSASESSGPCVIISTPHGHVNDLGAVMAAITAQSVGWHAVYLGTNLPTDEIAHAAKNRNARAVALNVCRAKGDLQIGPVLTTLRGLLPPTVELFVCGGAAQTLGQFGTALATLRGIEPVTTATA